MAQRKLKQPVFVCPHCGNKTPHEVVFSHNYVGDWYGSNGEPSENPPESSYTGYACSTCGDLCIYETHEYDDGGRGILVFPANVDLDKSIPEIVASNYRESKRVQKVSPNAFAVLIRRALEALCDDRKVPAGTLHARLAKLAGKGEIPPILVEITSVLRILGNSGAHNTDQAVTVPITWQMDKFFRTLVEYVYVAPARLDEFRKSIGKDQKEEAIITQGKFDRTCFQCGKIKHGNGWPGSKYCPQCGIYLCSSCGTGRNECPKCGKNILENPIYRSMKRRKHLL